MRAFQASGKAGRCTLHSPRGAALAYFRRFPTSRKCSVYEGEADSYCFTYIAGKGAGRAWRDVTKKTAAELPEI